MPHPRYTSHEVATKGEEIYAQQLKEKLEPTHTGKFLVIDVDTGSYEIDADEVAALQRAMARNPHGARYLKRIGHPVAHRLGGRNQARMP